MRSRRQRRRRAPRWWLVAVLCLTQSPACTPPRCRDNGRSRCSAQGRRGRSPWVLLRRRRTRHAHAHARGGQPSHSARRVKPGLAENKKKAASPSRPDREPRYFGDHRPSCAPPPHRRRLRGRDRKDARPCARQARQEGMRHDRRRRRRRGGACVMEREASADGGKNLISEQRTGSRIFQADKLPKQGRGRPPPRRALGRCSRPAASRPRVSWATPTLDIVRLPHAQYPRCRATRLRAPGLDLLSGRRRGKPPEARGKNLAARALCLAASLSSFRTAMRGRCGRVRASR